MGQCDTDSEKSRSYFLKGYKGGVSLNPLFFYERASLAPCELTHVLKIVIYVENYPQKRCFRLAYYHPLLGWGGVN